MWIWCYCPCTLGKKCNFLSLCREKSEMSSLGGSRCLWPICFSPLYRSCISDAWMHKWLTCLHISLSPSTPSFAHKTQRRFISTIHCFLISLHSALPVKISHVTLLFPLHPESSTFLRHLRVPPFSSKLWHRSPSFINLLPPSLASFLPRYPAPFLSSSPSY